MAKKELVLYIGGFELPDKNAAAQRVIGIAKGLRELQYEVIFLNSVKNLDNSRVTEKQYFEFKCYEYKRECEKDYLITGKTALSYIADIKPNIVIAYNYPGIALEKIRKKCKKAGIKVYADTTEWYKIRRCSFLYKLIKTIDTEYRMRIVQKRMDGVIAISRFLYNYYRSFTHTVLIPPTVDIKDEKWVVKGNKRKDCLSFVYAGSPSAQKERLDLIVEAINKLHIDQTVIFNVIGINKEQFIKMYSWKQPISNNVVFHGWLGHEKTIEIIKQSDWNIIL